MPLVDLKTDLKSLKYGKDRPGGGSSNQPFIQTSDRNSFDLPIDRLGNEIAGIPAGPDFILRGGLLAPARAATDVSRLTQMFFQTAKGAQFTAKQNLLSRTAVKLQAGNTIYNPSVGGLRALGDLVLTNGLGENGLGGVSVNMRNAINPLNEGTYTPLSTLGQALGNPFGLHLNKQGIDPTGETSLSIITYSDLVQNNQPSTLNRLVNLYGGKILTHDNTERTLLSYPGGPGSNLGVGRTVIQRTSITQYKGIGDRFATLSQEDLSKQRISKEETRVQDFRKVIKKSIGPVASKKYNQTGALASGLDYSNPLNRIETRVNLGDPGNRNIDRSDYAKGGGEARAGVDKINSLYLYKSSNVTNKDVKNDLVKFRIAVIDQDNPTEKTFIHFRSYISGISDQYTSDWSEFKYLGRGEKFYNYQGFDRQLSLNWTVVAQSREELSIMYQKLNYLASTLAPNYSDAGFMRGNIHQLTVGGYVYEYPGIITSLTFTTPDDSTWEIAIPSERSGNADPDTPTVVEDIAVKELAHRIEVSMTFKPINPFLPQTVKDVNGTGSINERFLSLTADSGKENSLYNKGIPKWAKV